MSDTVVFNVRCYTQPSRKKYLDLLLGEIERKRNILNNLKTRKKCLTIWKFFPKIQ